ncbi:hypothetical protein DF185_00120 [Marinifilum breve]|uniref:PD-(D/E)XK nuclease superfamily protein n=1 Tax=Marinifilum breve TaxID=2184082 RepID=A0A2V4A0Y7_9BACT|nr:PD-(D/E)XK nuclease family protein [Marinifilum breve]PXY02535.1 hypothetical protein DF185_00120 [Marinifilum breve]
MTYVLSELQDFLQKTDIPKIKVKPKTFLGIAKQPHYENVLSNLYAFFFNVNEEHGLKKLFISSFLEILERKMNVHKSFSSLKNGFSIRTEFGTGEGRIDLLFTNDLVAIIIENKVYHILNNDLDDYWESISRDQKIGVVLSLRKIPFTGHENFINVTHLELMNEVINKLNDYKEQANPKYLVFLEDLHQNIKNLSMSHIKEDELELFLAHKEKINQVVKYRKHVQTHVEEEIEKACKELGGNLKLVKPKDKNRGKRLRYMQSPVNKDLMITVVYGELLNDTEGKLYLIVELRNKLLKKRSQFRQINFSKDTESIRRDEFFTEKEKDWDHFASNEYAIHLKDLHDLSFFIVSALKKDGLYTVYKQLNDFLKGRKKSLQKLEESHS